MRILFVWPNVDTFGVKPIGISLLIAMLKKAGHEVDLFDTTFIDLGRSDYNQELTKRGYFKPVDYGCDISKKPVGLIDEFDKKMRLFKPELVMFSVLSDEVEIAKKLINHIHNNYYPIDVLAGNKAVDALREKVDADEVIIYRGEALSDIVEIIKNESYCNPTDGELNSPGYFKNLDSLPYLDWSHFDPRHFLRAYDGHVYRSGDYMIGWGCINSCTYCINESWREMHGGMKGCIRHYSINRVISELEKLSGRWRLQFFKFHDEDFLLKPHRYFEDLAIEYDAHIALPFSCMTNARSVTESRAALLAIMGCVSVSIGIETGDPVMRSMLNRKETTDEIMEAVRILKQQGIRVSSFNMIGLPYESEETIEATIELNSSAGIEHPNVSFYIPLPGTRLHNISVAAGFYKEGDPVSTDKPSLKLPTISNERLQYYYDNFHRLVTG